MTNEEDDDAPSGEEMDLAEESKDVEKGRRVYLPGQKIKDGEVLVHDPSAYIMLHEAETGFPCLSFDVIRDDLGESRELYPLTVYLAAGTQAERSNANSVIIMKMSNLTKTLDKEEESSEEESDSENNESKCDIPVKPRMESFRIKHNGCVNRIRCTKINNVDMAAVWSEVGKVSLFKLKDQLELIETGQCDVKKGKPKSSMVSPVHVFSGHQNEGYAIDWSSVSLGWLATGDCSRNIHIWRPLEGGWHVDQRPLLGHTASVEDLQWSPMEPNVLASCSVDKSIRIWDTREAGKSAGKLTLNGAHSDDINVISWNKKEPLIVSGGDDCILRLWDLRNFKSGAAVATLKHHNEGVTSVEWNPHESSIFASSDDEQIAIWDLAAERDQEQLAEASDEIQELPQELLFIHQGQEEIKELHWHPQIPGLIISTANTGFNFFRTISV